MLNNRFRLYFVYAGNSYALELQRYKKDIFLAS